MHQNFLLNTTPNLFEAASEQLPRLLYSLASCAPLVRMLCSHFVIPRVQLKTLQMEHLIWDSLYEEDKNCRTYLQFQNILNAVIFQSD